ncbi:MAG: V-type ATP synthase subunit I [Candidatus Poseidoniia archaeon]|nr:V-type ATP synthase subunit I [Candidatus Poseidoniia archaeon]MDP7082110.1 V-type ATP synthase subunit I [Candidatus Poseidoniia archaeon]MDP7255852.1 V-type ATP synthase subunit I [Candidatus Poseidoniia archaeon]
MLRPEPMSKLVLCGLNSDLPQVSHILSQQQLVHMIDYDGEADGFTSGGSLEYGATVSGNLVRVRSLLKILSAEPAPPGVSRPANAVETEITERLDSLEQEVLALNEKHRTAIQQQKEGQTRLEMLRQFEPLGLPLEVYDPYESLTVFTGTLPEKTELDITGAEILTAGDMLAVFVLQDSAEAAERTLTQHGFRALEPPSGNGLPTDVIAALELNLEVLETEEMALEHELEALAQRHGQWLVTAEEHLAAQAEKSELPLKLAQSENTFVLEGWLPEGELRRLKAALNDINLELEIETTNDTPPVKLDNPTPVKPFELFTKLYAIPDHRELDPSVLLFLGYPLFFGMMIGDLGYGLVYFLLGYMLVTKYGHSEELLQLGKIIRIAGASTMFFGTFAFAEAFGFELHWLAHELPYHVLHKSSSEDVAFMLLATGGIGLFYVTLGLMLGFWNMLVLHDLKHAVQEKFSWIMILWGGLMFIPPWLFGTSLIGARLGLTGELELWGGLAGFLLGLGMAVAGEGIVAIVEVPSIFVQVISYVRIAALGIADYGLAHAFNGMAFDIGFNGTSAIFAVLILVIGQLVVITLGLIGSGINALRLQYVECFPKFFVGGGTDYAPFGYTRKYTNEMETKA